MTFKQHLITVMIRGIIVGTILAWYGISLAYAYGASAEMPITLSIVNCVTDPNDVRCAQFQTATRYDITADQLINVQVRAEVVGDPVPVSECDATVDEFCQMIIIEPAAGAPEDVIEEKIVE